MAQFDFCDISYLDLITLLYLTASYVRQVSNGAHLLHRLAGYAAGLPEGQAAVAAVLELDADFMCR